MYHDMCVDYTQHIGPGDQTQVARAGSRCLSLPNNIDNPLLYFLRKCLSVNLDLTVFF